MTRWNMTNVRVSYRLFLVLPFCHLVIFSFCHVSTAQDFGRRQRTYDVEHYRIEVRLDDAARRVDGETDVTLQPLRTEIDTVAGERWFCDEAEAKAAGWRAARSR